MYWTPVEKFLVLLFGAIVVGIIVTNPAGVNGFFQGLANFTSGTVGAFSGGGGFAARTGNTFNTIPHVGY